MSDENKSEVKIEARDEQSDDLKSLETPRNDDRHIWAMGPGDLHPNEML